MNIPEYLRGEYIENQNYNELLTITLRGGLSDNGFTIPNQTTADITAIGLSTFVPVMPKGTLLFDSTINKLKVITVAAIPLGQPGGPANATIETITSV